MITALAYSDIGMDSIRNDISAPIEEIDAVN
jgi:hypothetical protein